MKWTKTDKDTWIAADVGESVPARIKQLDGKTFCVYRGGKYLGAEGDLAMAEKRADLNVRSEPNREMDWQRAHPDEQPLGLRLTAEERALRAAPIRQQPIAPRSARNGGSEPLGTMLNVPKVKVEAAPVAKAKAKAKAPKGNRDTELLTLLKRGCTTEEVLRVTGWQAISMPQLAKRLGVGLRIDKSGKPFRYFAEKEK